MGMQNLRGYCGLIEGRSPGAIRAIRACAAPWQRLGLSGGRRSGGSCMLEASIFAYDDQLLAAVEPAPQSIDDAIRIMQAIDAICPDGDGLKWFNRLYLGVTQAAKARVDAGGFQDAAWMAGVNAHINHDLPFAIVRTGP